MPPVVKQWPEASLERRAYDAVQSIPAQDENDRNRLGYNIFLYLKGELPGIEEALHVAQPRLLCSREEALRTITMALDDAPKDDAP
jgi:hypothetical protein